MQFTMKVMAVSAVDELAILIDVLIKRGFSSSEINQGINQKIKDTFTSLHPNIEGEVKIFRDEQSGDVKVFVNGKDETPNVFQQTAHQVSKEYLLHKIKESDNRDEAKSTPQNSPTTHSRFHIIKWIVVFLFYFYNIIYLISLVFWGYLLTQPGAKEAFWEGVKEIGYLRATSGLVLFLVPLFCFYKLVRNKWYRDDTKTLKLFFLFEVPVVFLLFITTFVLTNATKVTWWFSLSLLVIPIIGLNKLESNTETPTWKKKLDTSLLAASTLLISYLALIYAFYFPPALFSILKQGFRVIIDTFSYGSYEPGYMLQELLMIGIGSLGFLILLALLFVPFILAGVAWKVLISYYNSLVATVGFKYTRNLITAVVVITLLITAVLSYQPPASKLLDKLAQFNDQLSFEEQENIAKELTPHQELLKENLEDMSNVSSRYLMAKDDDGLEYFYREAFGSPDAVNYSIQKIFTLIAYPFIYQGPSTANYKVFDNYHKVFNEYYYSSYKYEEPKNVRLVSRTVSANTSNNQTVATINVEEEYEQSKINGFRDEEILYEFSLPEGAVVTDLKLGPALEFQGVIAPRGAAQKTYQQEVSKFRDPAILEQTGPRQYRLRVFPIPTKENKTTLGGKNQKVRFSYVTLLSNNGFDLPTYSREQNIDINSAKFSLTLDTETKPINKDTKFIAGNTKICNLTGSIEVKQSFATESAWLVPANGNEFTRKKLLCDPSTLTELTNKVRDQKLAIIYDASVTNKDNATLNEIKSWISKNGTFLENNKVDFYKFSSTLSKPTQLTKDSKLEVTYFGEGDLRKLLPTLTGKYMYDQYIIVTGLSKYPTYGKDPFVDTNLANSSNLYFVFKDNKIPSFSQDFSLNFIRTRGHLLDSFEETMANLVEPDTTKVKDSQTFEPLNSYWSVSLPTTKTSYIQPTKTAENSQSLPIITAAVVKDRLAAGYGFDMYSVNDYHNQAVIAGVVTPISSYIALVNETQKQNLENFSESADKYVDSYIPPSGGGGGLRIVNPGLGISPLSGSFAVPNLEGSPTSLDGGSAGAPASVGIRPAGMSSYIYMNFFVIFLVTNVILVILGLISFVVIRFIRNRRR